MIGIINRDLAFCFQYLDVPLSPNALKIDTTHFFIKHKNGHITVPYNRTDLEYLLGLYMGGTIL
jgi:hypothetical protein